MIGLQQQGCVFITGRVHGSQYGDTESYILEENEGKGTNASQNHQPYALLDLRYSTMGTEEPHTGEFLKSAAAVASPAEDGNEY